MSMIKVGSRVYANEWIEGVLPDTEGLVKEVQFSGAEFPLYLINFCGKDYYLYEYEFFVLKD